jgi:hypothetical protein
MNLNLGNEKLTTNPERARQNKIGRELRNWHDNWAAKPDLGVGSQTHGMNDFWAGNLPATMADAPEAEREARGRQKLKIAQILTGISRKKRKPAQKEQRDFSVDNEQNSILTMKVTILPLSFDYRDMKIGLLAHYS